jgi:hypothetical protein
MQGVPFRVDGKGRVLVGWMSRDRAYWSISDEAAGLFAPRTPAPGDGKADQAYPVAVANPKGEVLLAWKQGKEVRWAVYRGDGSFTGSQGKAGELPGRNKPTAFVGADGTFYVMF